MVLRLLQDMLIGRLPLVRLGRAEHDVARLLLASGPGKQARPESAEGPEGPDSLMLSGLVPDSLIGMLQLFARLLLCPMLLL
jgi:hypothetical protein